MSFPVTTIQFQGDTLYAAQSGDAVHVAVKPICDGLGIDWEAQRKRIQRDRILSEGASIMEVPSAGGLQRVTALRLDLMNGWLFGIDASRVRPAIREKVLAYKRECYGVLFRHFYGKATGTPPRPSDTLEANLRAVREARLAFGAAAARRVWIDLKLPASDELASYVPRQRSMFDPPAETADTKPASATVIDFPLLNRQGPSNKKLTAEMLARLNARMAAGATEKEALRAEGLSDKALIMARLRARRRAAKKR